MHRWILWAGLGLSLVIGTRAAEKKLELRPNDHICVIGNTLADRLQHEPSLEAMIYARFPRHNLVFRHLGYSGDEITTRLRVDEFGSPDEWLKRCQATVILAFFGYNESFKGPDGLDKFKRDLDKFIKDTLKQNYSGQASPPHPSPLPQGGEGGTLRLVLFSPIAQERHRDPNFPDPAANNNHIALYTQAMAETAKANGILFIDLFAPSQALYQKAKESLTDNGVHLSDAGYQALAPVIFQGLFAESPPRTQGAPFDKLRGVIAEKNAIWFSRYRTVDGYNVYGGRSYLKFNGVMNRDTMLREMEMRDVMTANRDQRIWAVAQGGDLKVTDDNLPPPVQVISNKPGKNPDGSYTFLSGEEAIKHMKLAKGCKVNLYATEEQFPDLVNPVQMGFDTRGRLWIAAWRNYPSRTPQSKQGDCLLVFEDRNGDGKADQCTPFLDDLNCPTGFQFYKDGVILVQAPDVWFLRDTNGDGKGDWGQRVLNGISSADTHHTANSLVLDPGGAIYLSDGVFHRTQVETAWGLVRNNDAAISRFEPRTGRYETYAPYGFANPHGRVFDRWGNDLITDATGNNTYFGPAISGHLDYPDKHPGIKEFWQRPSRPCPGTGMLSSRHFPEDWQGNFLNCNVIGFLGIFRVKVTEDGSGLKGETLEHLVQSDDPNFRPTGVCVGPDGALYFMDWQNPLIGHMQHHMRDPSRDHAHGRIYRITYEGRPLLTPPKIAGQPIENLLDLLKTPEDDVRTRAKIELGARDSRQVMAAVNSWIKRLDAKDPDYEHQLMEALWVHQWQNIVDEGLLKRMLRSPEPHARAAATRVLCYWRDRISQPLALLQTQAEDESPRVRLEAVRAASFFEGPEAVEVALASLKYDTDYYLDYVFKETMRQLRRTVKQIILPKDPRAQAAVLAKLSNTELLQAPATEAVLIERLERPGFDFNTRSITLNDLAQARQSSRLAEALASLRRLDSRGKTPGQEATDLGLLLAGNQPQDLDRVRADLVRLAENSQQILMRRAGYASLIAADAKPDALWTATANNSAARALLIDSIGLLLDGTLRATFQPRLAELIADAKAPANTRSAALRALPLMGPENAAANFKILTGCLQQNRDCPIAARALMLLPRESWVKDQAGVAVNAILAWAKTVPASARTAQDYVETVQAGMQLASMLPESEALRVCRSLREVSVSVLVLKTLREQMRFDTTRLVVEAGKPFEIIFENTDVMPHNLVITQPGARAEVGQQAQTMGLTPDNQGRLFVPRNKKIIAASHLLESGQKETLKLTAPAQTGTYDYLCSYPEHWQVMYGELLVVKDVDELIKASTQAPPPPPPAQHQHHSGFE